MIRIYNAENDMEAIYLCNLLEEAGINSYMQEPGSGQYLKIASGINIYGTDLYVNEADAAGAKEIVQQAMQEKANEQKLHSEVKIPWYHNRTILARIILAWAAISGLIVIICSL